jgi:hypothetical protein
MKRIPVKRMRATLLSRELMNRKRKRARARIPARERKPRAKTS